MTDDLYSLWLKVPPGERPPNHYALLGLPRFCDDVPRIEAAAQKRLDGLDRYALHPDPVKRDACQQVMNEVARARVVLINPQKREAYDLTLKPATAPPPPAVMQVQIEPIALVPVPRAPAIPRQAAAIVKPPARKGDPTRWIAAIVAASVAAVVVVAVIQHASSTSQDAAAVMDHQPVVSNVEQPASPVSNPAAATASNDVRRPTAGTVQPPAVSSPPSVVAMIPPAPKVGLPDTHVQTPTRVPGPPATRPLRDPVPNAAEQNKAKALVNEIFANDLAQAKTPEGKADLAKKMLEIAAKTDDDPPGRYVLLSNAGDLATQGGDADTALAAIEQGAQHFQIDALKVKARALVAIARLFAPERNAPALAGQLDAVISEAIDADRYDLARDLSAAAAAAAAEFHDQAWLHAAQERTTEISDAEAEFQKLAPARATLERVPADANANFTVGSYRCFVKDDWPGGLWMLAAGSDPVAKALAVTELDNPTDAGKVVELADGWWSLSERRPRAQQPRLKRHAAEIYSRVVSRTIGPTRLHVLKRLDEAEAAEGNVVDLMSLVDVNKDATLGRWVKQSEGVISNRGTNRCELHLPYHPPDEYDLRADFTVPENRVAMMMFLTHDGRSFAWLMGQKFNKTYASLYAFNGLVKGLPNRTCMEGPVLNGGLPHMVLIKVRRDRVASYLDGWCQLDMPTDYAEADLMPREHTDSFYGFELDVSDGQVLFTKVQLIEITGRGHPLPHRNRV